jgi:hypothetical protein
MSNEPRRYWYVFKLEEKMEVQLPRHSRIIEVKTLPSAGNVLFKAVPAVNNHRKLGPQSRLFVYLPVADTLSPAPWNRLLARFNIPGREGEFLLYELNCPVRADRAAGDLLPPARRTLR